MSCPIIVTGGFPAQTPPVLDPTLSGLVDQSIVRAQGFGSQAFTVAVTALNAMGSALDTLAAPTITVPAFNAIAIDRINAGAIPVVPAGITGTFPAAPDAPVLTGVVLPAVGDVPVFTAIAPVVDFNITAPTALTATAPNAPGLNPVTIPAAPTLSLPSAPALFGLDIPAVPVLNLPVFDAVLADGPVAPSGAFSFTEPAYSDTLLDILKTRLYEMVNGMTTGIPPSVEQAIWDRGRNRESMLMISAIQDIRNTQASRGFTMPPGAAAIFAFAAIQKAKDSASTINRDVMVKQAEMEQNNRQFAITSAIQIEGSLLTYANSVAQRAYEAARYSVEVLILLFQARVTKYSADVQAFLALAEVFKTRLQGELAKLEIFKAQIEGQKVIGEINLQFVEIYKARVDAARIVIDLFKGQIEAAQAEAMVNKTQIEAFGVQVQAFGETVKAKATEYEGYATRVKAEVSKLEGFRTFADAYKSQVEGYSAGVQAKTSVAALAVKINQEVPLDAYKARVQGYQGQVSAVAEQVKAIGNAFDSTVRAYAANVQAQTAQIGSETEVLKTNASVYGITSNVGIEQARVIVQTLIEQAKLRIESIHGVAQVSAQLAAGAMSGISVSAGIHSSASESVSQSNSQSASIGVSISQSSNCSDITTHKGN